jgi:hypothetical protein
LKLRLNIIIPVQKPQLQGKLKHYTSRVAILCAFIYKTILDKNKKRGGIVLLLRPYCNLTLKPHLALKTLRQLVEELSLTNIVSVQELNFNYMVSPSTLTFVVDLLARHTDLNLDCFV